MVKAFLKFFVNFDVLNVKNRIMLEKFFVGVPVLVVLHILAN